jgi:hypothetical protein
MLSLLLQHGADPNALVYTSLIQSGTIPIFSTFWVEYLFSLFYVPPNKLLETKYLDVLDEFFDSGADLEAMPSLYYCEGLAIPIDKATVHEKFFSKLNSIGSTGETGTVRCNSRLLT